MKLIAAIGVRVVVHRGHPGGVEALVLLQLERAVQVPIAWVLLLLGSGPSASYRGPCSGVARCSWVKTSSVVRRTRAGGRVWLTLPAPGLHAVAVHVARPWAVGRRRDSHVNRQSRASHAQSIIIGDQRQHVWLRAANYSMSLFLRFPRARFPKTSAALCARSTTNDVQVCKIPQSHKIL